MLLFLVVVGLWAAFAYLAAESPGDLERAWEWLRGLPLLLELGMWLLAFPWALATAVWQTGWADWLRVALVACFTVGWTLAFVPRRRSSL